MLSKILSKSVCADCRFCCEFSREAMWEIPSSVEVAFPNGAQSFRCPHLDTCNGCMLGEAKPFACKLWPIRIMNYNGERYITLSTRCSAYSEEFTGKVLTLLKDSLLERINEELERDPTLVLDYHPSYRLLCTLDGKSVTASSSLLFHRAEIGDTDRIRRAVSGRGPNICQYSAGFLTALAGKYDTQICFDDNVLYVYMPGHSTDTHAAYLMPAGDIKDMRACLEKLEAHSASLNKKMMIWGALTNDLSNICECGYRYILHDDRDWWDYIYSAKDLALLPGNTFRKKRSALNKFMRDFEGSFCYHVIDKSNLERVRRYQKKWLCKRFDNFGEDEGLTAENLQINYMLDNFEALGITGGFVEIAGRIAGYTLALPLGSDSYDMTTLKTSRKYPNVTVYLISNFAKNLNDDVKYINFEEDIGSEGLRKFKSDFNPCALLKKSRAEIE